MSWRFCTRNWAWGCERQTLGQSPAVTSKTRDRSLKIPARLRPAHRVTIICREAVWVPQFTQPG